ncbi:hypothetical protein scyTo_0019437 [Scyliorhinus torazame]|uniref:Uncharacterized protein n=1 Tax=Scyliorhinus torazame TaxID=75743 RepID=A0A401PZM2_SCYTO|nr:hypothetical protein [Scyliorhinus torazame]
MYTSPIGGGGKWRPERDREKEKIPRGRERVMWASLAGSTPQVATEQSSLFPSVTIDTSWYGPITLEIVFQPPQLDAEPDNAATATPFITGCQQHRRSSHERRSPQYLPAERSL